MYHLNLKKQQEWEQNELKIDFFWKWSGSGEKKNLPTSILNQLNYISSNSKGKIGPFHRF